jgi:N-acetylneuraminate lyase
MSGKFHGVWPALVTPFTDDNEINIPVLRELVSYLIGKGIDGFYVGGTTGEGIFMSVDERQQVLEQVMAENKGRVPVIAHVGATALADAKTLARHARQSGVSGVSSIVPPYYDQMDSLVAYFSALAATVPELPVFPYFLLQNIKPLELMKRLQEIPNVKGTKYTGPDMYEFRQIVEMGGESWTIFSGMDEVCLFAAMMGAHGNIGSTLNFMPGAYLQIRALNAQGKYEEARAIQLRANHVTSILIDAGFQAALKAALGFIGMDCGQPRLPRQSLSNEARALLQLRLQESEFADLAAL